MPTSVNGPRSRVILAIGGHPEAITWQADEVGRHKECSIMRSEWVSRQEYFSCF